LHAAYGSTDFPGDFRQFEQRTGIAVPVSTPLTRANLFAAIRQRRTFSSSNKHLSAMYTANNLPMGSVLTGSSPVPIDLNIAVRENFPDRSSFAAKNICSIELWTSGTLPDSYAPLAVWTDFPGVGGAEVTFTRRLWLPYFKDYFFVVNAAHACGPASPPESRLVTAPIWTAAQFPKPTATAPRAVTPGNALTVQWAAPGVGNVRLQAYKLNGLGNPVPVNVPAPVTVPNNGQANGQYTWSSTAGWPIGTYRIGVADAVFPGYEWKTQNIHVAYPPEEPPVECPPGKRLCN
jgi:hypothetical protein